MVRKTGKRKMAAPRPVSALLDGTFTWLRLDQMAASFRAMQAFEKVAGKKLVHRARAERLLGRTLVVRVASSAWAQELGALKTQLLEKLKNTPGGETIADFRFQVGNVDEIPSWETLVKESAHRPGPTRTAKKAVPPPPSPPALKEIVDSIPDPELRKELTKLYANFVKSKE